MRNPTRACRPNQWIASRDCEIFYARLRIRCPGNRFAQQLQRTDYDILHLNTIFSRRFGILPLILRRFGSDSTANLIMIAPRGELAPGALAIKSGRKKSFLAMARGLGLFDAVTWQASGDRGGARHMPMSFGRGAPNNDQRRTCSAPIIEAGDRHDTASAPGNWILCFSRASLPMKNLHLAIEALRGLEGDITFRIAGPIDDAKLLGAMREVDCHSRDEHPD